MMQILLGGTVAQSSHMDLCPCTYKWFPNRKAAKNAKQGAGPLMRWPFKGNPAQYHDALRSRHFPASTIIGLDVHGQPTPQNGSPCTFRLFVCAENFMVDCFDPSLCRVKPSGPPGFEEGEFDGNGPTFSLWKHSPGPLEVTWK
jgi:hypothetical protein